MATMASSVDKMDALISSIDSVTLACEASSQPKTVSDDDEKYFCPSSSASKTPNKALFAPVPASTAATTNSPSSSSSPDVSNASPASSTSSSGPNTSPAPSAEDLVSKYDLPSNATFHKLIPALYHSLTPPRSDAELQRKIREEGYKYYKEKEVFERVSAWMIHYNGNEWKKYLELDKEVHEMNANFNSYTRHLVANKKNCFRLMVLCWPGQVKSPIHDHGGSECWLRVLQGELEEQFYYTPKDENEPLRLKFKKTHKAGAVCFINDEQGLHRIVNPSGEKAVSLHCYVPGYDKCYAFLDESCVKKGKKQCLMSYSSVGGKHTKH